MIPGTNRPDVTTEALNMLEAYLHFESLNEFEPNNGDATTCADACIAQVDSRNPFGRFTSSAAGFDPSTNSLRRKFAWLDPLNRVEYTSPSLPRSNQQPNHRCSLCGKNVGDPRRKSRSALSAQCSPERRIPLETRNSLPFGCERLLQSGKVAMSSQGGKVPVFSLAHTEEVSDLEGLSSPCPPPLIEYSTSDSQPQSVCDKIDGIESFQRQQSSFSTSASIGLSSLPTSGLPSRTSSQAKVQIQIQNTLSPSGDSHPGGLALRSRSAGSSNLTQKCHVIHPSVHWTSQSDATDQAISYVRCESVHSAPGDARHRIDLEKTGRDSSRKWFRFSLQKSRRKLSRPFNLSRNSGSFSVNHSTTWNSTNNEDPSVAVQKQSRHSGNHLGLDSLLHLIPRWFRGHDTSPDTYVSTGFPVRLRRSVFRNASRRKRHKVYEQSGEKNSSVKERFLRVPNLSPIYIPDRLSDRSARPMTEGSMASNDGSALPASTTIGPHKLAPSDTNGAGTTPSRLVTSPSMLSEVSRLYEEILHTAEGGRLGESTVQVWRSFTDRAGQTDNSGAIPHDSPMDVPTGHANPPSTSTITASGRPLSSIDELHSTCSYNHFCHSSSCPKPDQIMPTVRNQMSSGDPTFLIASDPTTPDAAFLNRGLTRSNSQSSHSKTSASSSDSPIMFSPMPDKSSEPSFDPSHPPVTQNGNGAAEQNVQKYAFYVAAMIDVLSQRIMNQITEDDLDQRLRRLEVEAAASLGGTVDISAVGETRLSTGDHNNFVDAPVCPGSAPNSVVDSVGVTRPSAPESNHRKPSLLSESHTIERVLLAQVRRLERRKKLDIKIDLFNHLPRHTQYTTFEADMLRLLGRQPSWHHIAILYYLARCTVRHVLKTHLAELDALQHTTTGMDSASNASASARLRSFSSAAMLVELNQVERKFSMVNSSLARDKQTQENMIAEIGRCRARVERVKDFTMTFFTRWYADWVSKHGGWRSLIEDAEDSELD